MPLVVFVIFPWVVTLSRPLSLPLLPSQVARSHPHRLHRLAQLLDPGTRAVFAGPSLFAAGYEKVHLVHLHCFNNGG